MMKGKCIENTDRVLLPNGSYCVYGAQTGTRNGEYVAAGNRADGVSRNGAGISALLYCTLTRKEMEIDLYNVDFAKYDRIILMIPVIFGRMSAPMRSFILQEEGNLKNVEYIIIHKGLKARHPGLVRWLDRHIGQKHLACSSIWQQGKRELHITYVDGESVLKQRK